MTLFIQCPRDPELVVFSEWFAADRRITGRGYSVGKTNVRYCGRCRASSELGQQTYPVLAPAGDADLGGGGPRCVFDISSAFCGFSPLCSDQSRCDVCRIETPRPGKPLRCTRFALVWRSVARGICVCRCITCIACCDSRRIPSSRVRRRSRLRRAVAEDRRERNP